MKKIAGLALVGILIVMALTGCSDKAASNDVPASDANFNPEATGVPSDDSAAGATDAPLLPQVDDVPLDNSDGAPDDGAAQAPLDTPAAEETIAPETGANAVNYTFQSLADRSFGFVFEYPTQWENLPGKHTVCFREVVENGDIPCRVAVTKKTFSHPPRSSTVMNQFYAYYQQVCAQYDPSTLELGSDLNSEARFMGQQAYEITYLAYQGQTEIKGYMICCAVEHSIYVFHFSAPYADYQSMEPMMLRMRDSVAVVE